MKSCLFFLPLIVVLLLYCNKKNQEPLLAQTQQGNIFDNKYHYFDCNYYHYFKDSTFLLSREDSILLLQKAKEKNIAFRDVRELSPFLPDIKLMYNKYWITKLEDDENKKDVTYEGLSYNKVHQLTKSDAVVIGEILDIENTSLLDTNKCLLYKRSYVIKVDKVLHSYFPLNQNDKVLVKVRNGFEGCGNSKNFIWYSHEKEYKIGDKGIFLLSNQKLRHVFLMLQKPSLVGDNYDDKFCPQAFELNIDNSLYNSNNTDLITSIKIFFNSNHFNN